MKYDLNYKSLNILLADDDEDDRQLLQEAIKSDRIEHTMHTIPSGEQLMNYLALCNGNTPDLIFLDLNMPRKNGMECLIEMRADKKFNNTVIAIYSTSSAKKDINTAFLAGANIYITKPNNYPALQKIVSEVLSTNWQYHTSTLSKKQFLMVR
jgi:CheY-like chemotaxis protein